MFKKEKLKQAEESKTATLTIECSYWLAGHLITLIYTDDNSVAVGNDVIRRNISHIVDKNRVLRLTDVYDPDIGNLTPDKGTMLISTNYEGNIGVNILNNTDFIVTADIAHIRIYAGGGGSVVVP